MKVENVARIRFTSRWTFQNERHLAVSRCVLGKIIINDQRIHAIRHEPLADRCACVWSDVLIGSRVSSRSRNDDRVFKSSLFFENAERTSNIGILLANRHVDRVYRTEIRIARCYTNFIDVRLVDDRIDRDGRLTGTAVANDELALSTADWNHRIDRLDTSHKRLINRLTLDNTRSDSFNRISLGAFDCTLAINWLSQSINYTTEKSFANWDRKKRSRAFNFVALLEVIRLAENNRSHFVFFQVKGDTDRSTRKRDHLVIHYLGQTVDLRNAVADL